MNEIDIKELESAGLAVGPEVGRVFWERQARGSDPLTKPGDPPLDHRILQPKDIRIDDVANCPILTFAGMDSEPVTVRLTPKAADMLPVLIFLMVSTPSRRPPHGALPGGRRARR